MFFTSEGGTKIFQNFKGGQTLLGYYKCGSTEGKMNFVGDRDSKMLIKVCFIRNRSEGSINMVFMTFLHFCL